MAQLLIAEAILINLETFKMHDQTVRAPLDLHLPRCHLLSLAAVTVEFVCTQHPLLVCELFYAVVQRSTSFVNVNGEGHKGFFTFTAVLALEAGGL